MALIGHLGTHFDVMNKEFPLEYIERTGIVFNVSSVKDRDIDISDINLFEIEEEMFVAFYTGFIEKARYGCKKYFSEHPQLSKELIDVLLERNISIIGIDFAGLRRGKEHTPMDHYCADRGVFMVENLCNLKEVIKEGAYFTANTYPLNYSGISGLPYLSGANDTKCFLLILILPFYKFIVDFPFKHGPVISSIY